MPTDALGRPVSNAVMYNDGRGQDLQIDISGRPTAALRRIARGCITIARPERFLEHLGCG